MVDPLSATLFALQAAPHVYRGGKWLYNWWQGGSPEEKRQKALDEGYGQAGLDLLQQLGNPMQGQNIGDVGLDPLNIGALQQQARQQFQRQTVPGLAERFTAGGGGRSSAFNQQLAQAGGDLEAQLAALGPQFEQQRRGQLLQQRGQDIGREGALGQLNLGRMAQLRGLIGDRGQQQLGQQALKLRGREAQQGALGSLGNMYGMAQQGRQGLGRNVNQLLGMMGNTQGGFPNSLIPQGYYGG